MAARGGQAVGENAAGTSGADDDIVKGVRVRLHRLVSRAFNPRLPTSKLQWIEPKDHKLPVNLAAINGSAELLGHWGAADIKPCTTWRPHAIGRCRNSARGALRKPDFAFPNGGLSCRARDRRSGPRSGLLAREPQGRRPWHGKLAPSRDSSRHSSPAPHWSAQPKRKTVRAAISTRPIAIATAISSPMRPPIRGNWSTRRR